MDMRNEWERDRKHVLFRIEETSTLLNKKEEKNVGDLLQIHTYTERKDFLIYDKNFCAFLRDRGNPSHLNSS
jgi:hypothetical protein